LKKRKIKIIWPNKIQTYAFEGDDWLLAANNAGIDIPTGCLTGSCGACEIDVNGETIRTCITSIEFQKGEDSLRIEFTSDPYW
tara:strand:- start:20 stop:268 length:249 start_codon:yes stop_codon:yes gene_type:complete